MSREKRTQQPIQVTQFEPGRGDGRVLERGIIHRVVKRRTVKAPQSGLRLYSVPLVKWTYYYIDYKGEEYVVESRPNASPTGGSMWCLQLHGDDKFIPDPAKMVQA